jgi:hypothetical protein
LLCSFEMEWPNPTSMSFTAALFRSMVSMRRLVEDCRRDLMVDQLRAHKEG